MIRAAVLIVVLASMVLADDQRRAINDGGSTSIHTIEVSGFTIIGIEAHTTNAREATPDGIIPKQWQTFFSEGIPQKISNRIDSNFYAVYTEYASDHNGQYTYVIGAKVKEGTTPPSGMVPKHIVPGKYALFTSDKGPFPKVVPALWQTIFSLEDEGKLKRAYLTDFELYDQRAQDPQNGQIDLYIGVK